MCATARGARCAPDPYLAIVTFRTLELLARMSAASLAAAALGRYSFILLGASVILIVLWWTSYPVDFAAVVCGCRPGRRGGRRGAGQHGGSGRRGESDLVGAGKGDGS